VCREEENENNEHGEDTTRMLRTIWVERRMQVAWRGG
jgi:hypothetical protein